MADLYQVEVEPEVRSWLESLSDRDFGRVDLVDLLAEQTQHWAGPTAVTSTERSANCDSTSSDNRPRDIAHDTYEREGGLR